MGDIVEATKVFNFRSVSISQPINVIFALIENVQRIVSCAKIAMLVDYMCGVIVLYGSIKTQIEVCE